MQTENENRYKKELERKTENNDELEKETGRVLKLFLERVTTEGKTLNIALIRVSDCGKSSFCNSVMTAFSVGEWRERAMTGHYGGRGGQVTNHLWRYDVFAYKT